MRNNFSLQKRKGENGGILFVEPKVVEMGVAETDQQKGKEQDPEKENFQGFPKKQEKKNQLGCQPAQQGKRKGASPLVKEDAANKQKKKQKSFLA